MSSITSRDPGTTAGEGSGRATGSGGGGGRQRLVVAVTLIVGLAAGLGIARLLSSGDGPDDRSSVTDLDLPGSPAPDQAQDQPSAPAPPASDAAVPLDSATSPQAAVEGFLTAEALGDFEASYPFLSESDHVAYSTPALWVAAHADFPVVAGFEVERVTDATVVTVTAYRSMLDPVLGLIPARARGTWTTVEEDGGWRVSYRESTVQPLYPSDEGVVAAAESWASARLDCRAEGEAEGGLLGAPGLAEELCEAEGELALGPVGVLQDGTETTALLSAYGPEVFTWARMVPVEAPVPMQVVLAPVADAWQVFAVLPPGR